jgi:hypothetical protein
MGVAGTRFGFIELSSGTETSATDEARPCAGWQF